MAPSSVELALFNQAVAAHRAGRLAEAESGYRRILQANPRHFDALHLLGVVRAAQGDMQGSMALIAAALDVRKDNPFAHFHLAGVLRALMRNDEALAHYERAAALKPDFVEAQLGRATMLVQNGRYWEAADLCRRVVAATASGEAYDILGAALIMLGDDEEALAAFDRALALRPDAAPWHNDRGQALARLGRMEEALAAFERACALQPGFVEALNNAGNLLADLGRYQQAHQLYLQALKARPGHPVTYRNLGNFLTTTQQWQGALTAFDSAIAINPDDAEAHFRRSFVLSKLGRDDEALAESDAALSLDAEAGLAASFSFFARARRCDWHDRAARLAQLARLGQGGSELDPFALLLAFDDPALHLRAAKTVASPLRPAMYRPRAPRDRLRLAYLSQDFHEHPVAHHIAEIVERHDRGAVECFGVCVAPGPDSPIRDRLRKSFDRFIEAGSRSDHEIARTIAELDIDIVVDLGGYTNGGRSRLLSYRPAPLAAGYLGYPGTLGAPYVDYIMADADVIPEGAEALYAECVVRLPDSFFPADTRGRGDPPAPSRAQAGLPQEGFVFCAFNNTFKITPEVFDIWMRLLRAVQGSVLWLNIARGVARDNLLREAEARGVDGGRLIFADRTAGRDEHQGRIQLADVFLDTVPYGAHSTANDMLWAGVPVITCRGRSFASRVAASQLKALGAEELVVGDLAAYEALAVDLARAPQKLAALRQKLLRHRLNHPLFDMAGLCRHLEVAYRQMWHRHANGLEPQGFTVPRQFPS